MVISNRYLAQYQSSMIQDVFVPCLRQCASQRKKSLSVSTIVIGPGPLRRWFVQNQIVARLLIYNGQRIGVNDDNVHFWDYYSTPTYVLEFEQLEQAVLYKLVWG